MRRRSKKSQGLEVLKASGAHIASGLGGVVVGSAVGSWPSLVAGVATTLVGAYYNKTWLMSGGVAMMTSITPSHREAQVNGFQDEVSEAKDRVTDTLKTFGRKLMLHKISPEMEQSLALNGADQEMVLYGGGYDDFDTSEVDRIIRELEEGNAENVVTSSDDYMIEGVDMAEVDGLDALSLNVTA